MSDEAEWRCSLLAAMSNDPPPVVADDRARYDSIRKELLQALVKKRQTDKHLAQIEVQLYNLEASYLTETPAHSGGNIIQGFEGYLKNQTGSARRKHDVNDQDRIFSNSSLTTPRSLELLGDMDDGGAEEYMRQSNGHTGVTTVILPPAPRTQELTAAQQKKIRDKEYQRKKRASTSSARHRSTGTISGDEDASVLSVSSSRRPTKRARLADED